MIKFEKTSLLEQLTEGKHLSAIREHHFSFSEKRENKTPEQLYLQNSFSASEMSMHRKKRSRAKLSQIILPALLILFLSIFITGCSGLDNLIDEDEYDQSSTSPQSEEYHSDINGNNQSDSENPDSTAGEEPDSGSKLSAASIHQSEIQYIPSFSGAAYIAINNNQPSFAEADMTTASFEYYSELDSLGRCGVAYANVSKDTMPTEDRKSIGQVKPTGWHTIKYDCVDGKYLYNRCHLIGYQLTAENANKKNLITGTRFLNIDGMLPFENIVADYVKETNYHVLYRVTPVFRENNLLASGVQIEAYSVEDNGDGICFNVYCYNSQPGVTIDYATGDSSLSE